MDKGSRPRNDLYAHYRGLLRVLNRSMLAAVAVFWLLPSLVARLAVLPYEQTALRAAFFAGAVVVGPVVLAQAATMLRYSHRLYRDHDEVMPYSRVLLNGLVLASNLALVALIAFAASLLWRG